MAETKLKAQSLADSSISEAKTSYKHVFFSQSWDFISQSTDYTTATAPTFVAPSRHTIYTVKPTGKKVYVNVTADITVIGTGTAGLAWRVDSTYYATAIGTSTSGNRYSSGWVDLGTVLTDGSSYSCLVGNYKQGTAGSARISYGAVQLAWGD